jgi:hypothetical protein
MTLTRKLPCPSCGVNLKVAEDLPAGKRITCPKCKTPFAVPEEESEAEEVSPVEVTPRRPRKAAPAPEPEESEDEVRERPVARKRRKKPKKAPSKAPLVIGLVAGLVLLIGVGVTLAVVFWPKKKTETASGNQQPPSGQPGPGGMGPGGGMMGGGMGPRGGMPGEGMMGGGMRGGMPGGGMRGGMPGGFGPGGGGPGGGDPGAGGTGSTETPPEFAAGRKVFEAQKCTRCHATGGGRGRGPDLSHVGANRTADWISEHVRDPQSHNPRSRMPKYDESKISAEDLKALSEYLASLK